MNPCNAGNQYATYTLVVIDGAYVDVANLVSGHLTKAGHMVTIIHDPSKHQDIESAVSGSDVLIVFTDPSNEYAKKLANDFSRIGGTYTVAVYHGAKHCYFGFSLNLDPKELDDPKQCVLRLNPIFTLPRSAMHHQYLPHIYPEI